MISTLLSCNNQSDHDPAGCMRQQLEKAKALHFCMAQYSYYKQLLHGADTTPGHPCIILTVAITNACMAKPCGFMLQRNTCMNKNIFNCTPYTLELH